MNAPRIACLLAALVLTAPVDLFAQHETPVARGDRIRVTARAIDADPVVGTLLALGADTCVLEVEGRAEPLALPVASITGLEVSRGQRSNAGKGALKGGLAGASTGLVLGVAILGSGGSDKESLFAASMAGFTSVGAVVGLLIGAATQSDRWEEVPLDELRVGASTVAANGVEVSVTLRL